MKGNSKNPKTPPLTVTTLKTLLKDRPIIIGRSVGWVLGLNEEHNRLCRLIHDSLFTRLINNKMLIGTYVHQIIIINGERRNTCLVEQDLVIWVHIGDIKGTRKNF